ncbi:hypothetical protein [Micromonospora viridifaciens]|uniref:hypothetical protein n=1 Tax=Micromonospora viridifaciens TaxID=1881 RepID=UPI000B5ACF92|nr:hypothetical protein [Micromonospora viridifaciens]
MSRGELVTTDRRTLIAQELPSRKDVLAPSIHDINLVIDKQLQRVRGRLLHRATKTEESDAPLPLPAICVTALRHRYRQQEAAKEKAGEAWHDTGMIFTTRYGLPVERGSSAKASINEPLLYFAAVQDRKGPSGRSRMAPELGRDGRI